MDNNCQPGSRCRRWRTCDNCARIRQARIATAAERLATIAGTIDWTTLTPGAGGFAAVAAAREEFLRKSRPPGAIWTVERSPNTGNMHVNVLTTPTAPVRLIHAAAFHVPAVSDPRQVAAYISKREQMPTDDEYPGRLYGTAGPLWQWLTAKGQHAPIQAAAIQHDIDTAAGRLAPRGPARLSDPIRPLTRDDYRAIAARRLPDILHPRTSQSSELNDR